MKKFISKNFLADQDIEQLIGLQLRYGVITASVIVLLGGLIYLYQSGSSGMPSYHTFIGTKAGFTTANEIITGLKTINAKSVIQLGVIVLIATPILRIAFSLIGFILEKDRLYIGITFIVLSVMMISIFGGLKI
ncbi:DUF1634 domain-containing protein [Mucilaginibacter dorajii]|uniref:DUF1634 domain-containing protein n=1 Tax=Mucilaginibacter dorajii TaxID=692994 RepID=A0ABP7Q613_9SPHI|nr:DUF1634 domain-containing protein [Mucilaginibacter dorajii]MCS3732522.1 putative membrane protein [Mucilaginibacter dorajii]